MKRAFIVGIDYYPDQALAGCVAAKLQEWQDF
jgi:hypothetical protein